ncbi:MAG: molybdopterin-guanine dinucleotide biosynthesis protein B [Desulfobulbus propionicus]|nr:MAG: molybdopterin-guanine dinucleotide biosynthesis protein B [Desulfobulbus propionicus]
MKTPPIISFIGWHNSGKTTIASKVVRHLTEKGYRVGVIKSTKEKGIAPDQPGTDTDTHSTAGAVRVALAAPDQILIRLKNELDLLSLAACCFNDMDIVVVEGFKHTDEIAKIVVHREGTEPLYEMVDNVVAVVADKSKAALPHYLPKQSAELAAFIIKKLALPAKD